MADNLLIEIGTEELPPKALRKLAEAFAENIQAGLEAAELGFTAVNWLASPRRLAVKVSELAAQQADKVVEKRGPAVQAAFDADGNPTKAALGWARGNGISIEQAERLETPKGAWLLHKAEVKGKGVAELIPDIAEKALAKLPIPKPMRWGATDTQFIRPVHTATILYGATSIDAELLGVKTGLELQGHRFHHQGAVAISHADEYENVLRDAFVVADFNERKSAIKAQAEAKATELGGVADIDDDLLDEVTGLVEWPVVLVASFEEEFLAVPDEALIYTMKGDQKYFPVLDQNGALINKFIFVSNIESKDPSQVIAGNEKVVRPRLKDAEFFFETDKKKTLESRLESLKSVLFQKQLGTLFEKSERIAELAAYIAEQICADATNAKRAGLLSKTDLMTEMVMEFTGTQGAMGMHYARLDGEHEEVALAQNEQYMPRFAGDELPKGLVSCAVALADKFDTLAGIFGIGMLPKGDKDPFALRRAAIGALRIIVERELNLDIADVTAKAVSLFADKLTNDKVEADVIDFIFGRFRTWYQDQGFEVELIQAVLAQRPTEPLDFDQRVKAVAAFKQLDAAEALAAANKRVGNILAKYDGELSDTVDSQLLQEDAEKVLAQAVAEQTSVLEPVFAERQYAKALSELAGLREAVDSFFDNVMVMADDEAVKQNRLVLLSQLRGLFLRIADISVLQK
ncbi:glycine--tRNA ligase subunit beta [Saccharobesus litoralis]|uniref:Glycine--tRNA ligase beta subunit n=1 Tax=Saccharobesus litoralis TaxID=2172099 RepID=A0A2S0VQF3_9ALTE|nr:glycine--tRNA ligase subunit beta [Saccharobesus litoralis]AWB66446.1 glycine--tRNA ligase subunit beta [Saccharobesus litoralis]